MTYDLIQEQVLGSAAASVTFSSIPQGFKDLVLEATYFSSESLRATGIRFNSDSGTNYSRTSLEGNGSTASSGRATNASYAEVFYIINTSSTVPAHVNVHIFNYANTSTNKTLLARGSRSDELVMAYVSLWRSTNAISSMTFQMFNSGNLSAGSTFRLWGVVG